MKVYREITIDIETGRVLHADWYEYAGPVAHAKQTGAQQAADKTNVAKGQASLATGQQLQGETQGMLNTALPAYQSILKAPGYDPATKTAMTTDTLGGIGAAAGSVQDAATRREASTGNPAGYGAMMDKLARDRMTSTAQAETGLQAKFGDKALSERDDALKGIASLYGISSDTMAKLLQPQVMNPNKGGFSISGGIPGVIQGGYST